MRPSVERRDSGSGSGEGGHGSGSGGGGMSPAGERTGSKSVEDAGEPMEDVRQDEGTTSVAKNGGTGGNGKVGESAGAAPRTERVALPGFSEIEAATRSSVPV